MGLLQATLGALTLPPQWSYKPVIPQKRFTLTRTYGAVVLQAPSNQIIYGDQMLQWTVEGAFPSEFESLWALYSTPTPVLYTFSGYWNDVYSVYFTTFDSPTVRSRIFNLSGAFTVACVTSAYSGLSCST